MEKEGLVTLLDKFGIYGLNISSIATDRHVQIRAYLKKYRPDILHQVDVWHFGKSRKKLLSSIVKRKECSEVKLWIKAIINHLWWCCATCNGNADLLQEKWVSILFHIRGIYQWQGNTLFHQCEHPPLDQQRKWLKDGIHSYEAVKAAVEIQDGIRFL